MVRSLAVAIAFTLMAEICAENKEKWRKYKNKVVQSLPGVPGPEVKTMMCERGCGSLCFRNANSTACSFDQELETCSVWETLLFTLAEKPGARSIVRCMLYELFDSL